MPISNGASAQPDEHVMILSNLRRDSAWGKAHDCGNQSRVNCEHTSAPDTGTSPIQGNRRLAHRAHSRRIQIPPTIASGDDVAACPLAASNTKLDSFAPSSRLQD